MPSDILLANCYNNALRFAEEKQISLIAFCAAELTQLWLGSDSPRSKNLSIIFKRDIGALLKVLKLHIFIPL